jgi:hypothetical protein
LSFRDEGGQLLHRERRLLAAIAELLIGAAWARLGWAEAPA